MRARRLLPQPNAGLGRVERDLAVALAVGIAGKLTGGAKAKMRLRRIAERPAAIVALKILQLL